MAVLMTKRISRSGKWRSLRAALILAGLPSLPIVAAVPPTREYQIKAAAIYNIIAFTEWPASSFSSPESPLVIGILGEGPIAALLNEFGANETWQGRKVVLRRLSTPAEAQACHVLFVARSETPRWRTLSSQLAGRPILTIADAEDFARQGGVVQFAVDRNKIRLIVNLGVARSVGLTISSKVLRLANVIDSTKS